MAPKKNKQRERLEQSRASSSARAHQSLLASAGPAAAAPAFIGFASFAQPAPNAVQATPKAGAFYAKPAVQSIYDGSDHEVALALKMLAKKGAVTKTKALQTFLADVLPPRQPADIRPMLGHFAQLYTFEMRDQNDRKVRQLLNEVLAALADKMRPRAFVPHLQRLLPYWFLAMHDVNADVAAVAKKAFNTLFPETDMQKAVLEEHLPPMMEEFQSFFSKTPDTFEGIPLQPDEKEERYERCVSAAVLSIDAVVKFFAEQQMTDKLRDEDATCSVATVVASDKFTRLATASSKHPNFSRDNVRRAMYVALVTLSTRAKEIVAAREEAFGKVVLGILGDKSPANHEAMWNAVLTFLQTFPNVWHSSASFPKFVVSAVYPRLFAQIRHGFYGSGRSSFPTLLPFLSMVPLSVAVVPAKGQSALYTGVLEQCWKFIESKDARFCEPPAITAFFECITGFFSIFLKESANAAWLSEQDAEPFEANYVNQFEKVCVSSLTTTLSSPEFPEGDVALFASGMLEMSSRLRSFSGDSDMINTLKDGFTEKLHTWTRQAISSMVSKLSFVPSRVTTLIGAGVADAKDRSEDKEASQWLSTSKEVYEQSLDQVDTLVVESTFSPAKNASIARLLEAINGVCKAHPLDLLLLNGTDTPMETHFDGHYRPVFHALSEWKRSANSKSVAKTMRIALELTRPFFLAAKEKKRFLLQLFQDCDVQFGDMADASDIIQYGLQFPITEQGNKLWLSCGSWQNRFESGVSVSDQSDPTLQALQAIWQGKLLDEFLMISLKGRLDDLDASAFTTLLKACLGGLSNFPVVSSDAVVILCHFVLQNGADSSDAVVVQILTQLCELFYKLNGELPAELEVVEGQLYKLLFHLSARGSYRAEASALWARTVRSSLKKWSSTRTKTFVNELAGHVNGFLLADLPAGTVSFNTKLFAAYVKSYVQLGADQAFFSVSQLVEKLDAINLRCNEDSKEKLFYSRVLSGLGEVCEDEQVVDVLQAYFTSLISEHEEKAVGLVAKLVDVDVTHALTWVVFHSDDHIQRGVELVEILESYLTLEHLYEALKLTSGVLDKALRAALATCRGEHKREIVEYRDVVFLSKNQGAPALNQNVSLLTQEQHEKLDELSVAVLSIFSSVGERVQFVQGPVDGDWKAASTQTVAISLFSAMYSDNEASGGVVSVLKGFFALSDRDAISKPAIGLFEYLRLVTRAVKEEEKLSIAASIAKQEVINLSTQESIIPQLVEMLAPGSPIVVAIDQWVTVTEYVAALAVYLPDATSEFRNAWENVARLAVTHAIAGKAETAKTAAIKIQKRSSTLGDRRIIKGDEERIVLGYSDELATARLALMNLVSAMYDSNPDALQELAAHYREALLSTVLCALSESAELKASIVTTYVALGAPSQCFQLVNLWYSVEEVLATALPALRSTLTSIPDIDHVNRLVLESFGGIETLASLFNGKRYPLQPVLRVLLYILASYSGALRLRNYDASAIDVNAEDEAATESALAKVLIPKALRSALRAVFADKHGESSAANIRMRSRKQKVLEREDLTGKLLLWDLFLQLFPSSGSGGESSRGGEGASTTLIASSLSSYVARHGMLTNFLNFSSALLSQEPQSASKAAISELQDTALFDVADLDKKEDDATWSLHKARVFQLGTRVFFRTVVRLPAMVRSWWNDDCSRATRSWAAKYFEDHITPSVLAAELELIQKAGESTSAVGESWDDEEMTVKGSRVSREITTTYMKDECALEMVVRVPSSYPLRCVEVECTKRIGISEDRWRRWVLQIIRVTSSRDGSLLDAVLLWKHNVDKEFEGVEPCPICYSILNPKNMGLPSLPCKTCNNKYHNSCLYKWFNQSGKNKCPICQQPFC
ncbi:listerin E3 ubiquitin protein ligase 1 [Phytophthora pseudosyringae]|uniref:E3 ubiquitin-protein ligase listerin n=1 Tax=Phytophthora pseudosyringae TaxID=221518 RepID=A0A8T1W5I3_9STRA|nr:listerin E3 ubiquitin protein ligase 1 [Phytophthora pseudosyringae]